MMRLLKAARVMAVLFGFVAILMGALILFGALGKSSALADDIWVGAGSIVIGAILVVPVRRVLDTRFAPYWLAVCLGLPVVAGYGVAVSLWRMWKRGAFDPMIVASCGVWLLLVAHAEFSRRNYGVTDA